MSQRVGIKVVKRKDVETVIHPTNPETETVKPANEVKVERRIRRELVSTVTNWVSERRERNRVEEVQALRKMFGDATAIFGQA